MAADNIQTSSGLNVPVDEKFKHQIKLRAHELGLTISSYVRFLIKKDLREVDKMRRESNESK